MLGSSLRVLTLSLALGGLVGCNSAPDCAAITQSYRTACPDDMSDRAANIAIGCQALEEATICRSEAAALRACWAADFDGFVGALCGEDLFDAACLDETARLVACEANQPPPPAEPRCIGNSVDCRDLSSTDCGSQLGCIQDGLSCEGLEENCSAFNSSGTCGAQIGCQWDVPAQVAGSCIGNSSDCDDLGSDRCGQQLGCYPDGLSCEGLEENCSAFGAPSSCDAQHGCAWETPSTEGGDCIGNSIDCRDLSGAECEAQLGCVQDGLSCQGLEESCRAFRSSTSCGAQRGCQWEPA